MTRGAKTSMRLRIILHRGNPFADQSRLGDDNRNAITIATVRHRRRQNQCKRVWEFFDADRLSSYGNEK